MGILIRLDSLGRGVIGEGVEGASVDLRYMVRNRYTMDICPLYKQISKVWRDGGYWRNRRDRGADGCLFSSLNILESSIS
jgi:hypothetical protein